jgi:hypothetical protein
VTAPVKVTMKANAQSSDEENPNGSNDSQEETKVLKNERIVVDYYVENAEVKVENLLKTMNIQFETLTKKNKKTYLAKESNAVLLVVSKGTDVNIPVKGMYTGLFQIFFTNVEHNTLVSKNPNNRTKTVANGLTRKGNAMDGTILNLDALHQFYISSNVSIENVKNFLGSVSTFVKFKSDPSKNTHSANFQSSRGKSDATINYHTLNNSFNVTGKKYDRMPYVVLAMAAHECDSDKQLSAKVSNLVERCLLVAGRKTIVVTRGNGKQSKIQVTGKSNHGELLDHLEKEFFLLKFIQEKSHKGVRWCYDLSNWVSMDIRASVNQSKLITTSGHPTMDALAMALGMLFKARLKTPKHNEKRDVVKNAKSKKDEKKFFESPSKGYSQASMVSFMNTLDFSGLSDDHESGTEAGSEEDNIPIKHPQSEVGRCKIVGIRSSECGSRIRIRVKRENPPSVNPSGSQRDEVVSSGFSLASRKNLSKISEQKPKQENRTQSLKLQSTAKKNKREKNISQVEPRCDEQDAGEINLIDPNSDDDFAPPPRVYGCSKLDVQEMIKDALFNFDIRVTGERHDDFTTMFKNAWTKEKRKISALVESQVSNRMEATVNTVKNMITKRPNPDDDSEDDEEQEPRSSKKAKKAPQKDAWVENNLRNITDKIRFNDPLVKKADRVPAEDSAATVTCVLCNVFPNAPRAKVKSLVNGDNTCNLLSFGHNITNPTNTVNGAILRFLRWYKSTLCEDPQKLHKIEPKQCEAVAKILGDLYIRKKYFFPPI